MTTYTQATALKEVREALKVITNDLGCSIEAAGGNHAADKRIVMARVALEKLDAMISQKEAAPSTSQSQYGSIELQGLILSKLAAPSTSQPGYVTVHRNVLVKLGIPDAVIDTFSEQLAAPSTSQPLTPAVMKSLGDRWVRDGHDLYGFGRAVEAAHNIKGGV